MIDFRNPYTPGAGVMPKYLAGRDEVLNDAQKYVIRIPGSIRRLLRHTGCGKDRPFK